MFEFRVYEEEMVRT